MAIIQTLYASSTIDICRLHTPVVSLTPGFRIWSSFQVLHDVPSCRFFSVGILQAGFHTCEAEYIIKCTCYISDALLMNMHTYLNYLQGCDIKSYNKSTSSKLYGKFFFPQSREKDNLWLKLNDVILLLEI